MSDVAKVERNQISSGVSEETKMMMQMIEQVALNPDADVEKLRAVMDMKMQMFDRGAEIEFNAAMSRAQSEMVPVIAGSENKQTKSKYAKLERIIEDISPIWTKHGFALTFGSGECPKDGWYRVECEVSHSAGHSKKYHADLPPDMTGIAGSVNKTAIHGFGSTVSYGRRYLTCLVFNIAVKGEDNDGNKPPDNPALQCLNEKQLKNLRDAMKVAGVDDAAMCKKAGVEKVGDIAQARLSGAMNWLKSKSQGGEK